MRAPALFLALFTLAAAAAEDRVSPYFTVTPINTPPGLDAQIGGLDAFPDGRVVAAFHHGEVAIYRPQTQEWEIFATGLHEPLGVLVEPAGSILVMQRPELTRLKASTGHGPADQYETVWDGFGQSGNYHEFAFGPVRGPNGKLYVSLNLASNGASVHKEVRGEFSPIGAPRELFDAPDWKKYAKDIGRMYSRVPYRGWVVEIDPATGAATPFASGFRSPDGLGFDLAGNLLVDDNQGDWRGASELFVVKKDGFYGHPASLVWRPDWTGEDPLKLTVAKLNELRTPAAIWFPYGSIANSPTQILTIPKTPAWGPFGGQLIVGEMNYPRLLRALPEQVDGVWQGAVIPFIDGETVKRGGHRFVFTGDTLWIGRTHLSWAGAEGFASIQPTGKVPFVPLTMEVTPRGFRFTFTAPLDARAADPKLWKARRYNYLYHATYGSPETDKAAVEPVAITLSNNNQTAEVELPPMVKDTIYDFDLAALKSAEGEPVVNSHIAYTLRRIPR
ncbi:MAG TPA: hypothetical protein VGO11_15500 [Chthoniobacteraceae bacterium]|jgi:glucose/arabinose dehydrogenase|nr:hypothetical protein [Chthoniobacteraceae bacterium]